MTESSGVPNTARKEPSLLNHPNAGAPDTLGMDEGDRGAPRSRTRLGVDQLDALLFEMLERLFQVRHAVADVMHALAAPLEELPHGRIGTERTQELDPRFADAEHRFLDALIGNDHPIG